MSVPILEIHSPVFPPAIPADFLSAEEHRIVGYCVEPFKAANLDYLLCYYGTSNLQTRFVHIFFSRSRRTFLGGLLRLSFLTTAVELSLYGSKMEALTSTKINKTHRFCTHGEDAPSSLVYTYKHVVTCAAKL